MKYTFTAVFTPTEDGSEYYAAVPDLNGCFTTADNIENAIEEITDAASVWLVVAEDKDMPIPAATVQTDIEHDANSTLSLICVDTIAYRAQTDDRAVRKNVSLPAWMAALADKRGINCSQVLQEGLRAQLS